MHKSTRHEQDYSRQHKENASTPSAPKAEAILYGSQARGDERPDSDWDILVIVDKDRLLPQDYDNITYPLAKLGWNVGVDINAILNTRKEWETSRITPFYHNVQQDGIYLT